ncbi:PAS domain S-box protein [Marinicauda salina]|nr:PAS domain S-box protein [Marinicauda salina]
MTEASPRSAVPAALFEALPDPCAVIDGQGRITAANQAMRDFLGADSEALNGAGLETFLADPLDNAPAPWLRAEAPADPVRLAFLDAAGSARPAQVRVLELDGERAVLARPVALNAEAPGASEGPQRARLETRLSQAVQGGELAPWFFDFTAGQGHVDEVRRGRGTRRRPIIPDDWRANMHPEDSGRVYAAFLGLREGRRFDESYRTRSETGEWAWKRCFGAPLPDDPSRAAGFVRDITEFKALEAEAAQHQRDLNEAVEAGLLGLWTVNHVTGRRTARGRILEWMGHAPEEIELDRGEWAALLHPEDHPRVREAFADMAEGGRVYTFDCRVRAPDGWRWVRTEGRPVAYGVDGSVNRSAGVIIDISDERAYADALRRERDRLDEIYRNTPAMMHTIDVEGRIVEVSDYWLTHLGYAREEVVGRPAPEFLVEADRPEARRRIRDIWKHGAVHRRPARFLTRDGEVVEVEVSGVVERDSSGSARYAHAIFVDVTERNRLEAALRAEKTRFETVYRNSPAMLHTIDPEGRTTMVSDYWVERTGYARDEAVGRPGWSFMIPEDQARVRDEIIPEVVRAGRISNAPVRMRTKTGDDIELRLSAFLERDADGQPVAAHGVFNDVTDLNQAHRALERHAAELERTNRELGRFATVASHDLQEPLRKISAFASLLRRRYEGELDADGDRALGFLVDATGRMRRLIDDLLAYSRASNRPLDAEPLDLNALVAAVLSELEMSIEESAARVSVADLPEIRADRTLIRLLFQNLISNAIKYRKNSGPEIRIDAERSEAGWTFCVSDDGIGFEQKFAEKVFAPFQRLHTRDAYEGSGIGLAICQQAVERHGGTIRVDSAPGEGARFYFTLPDSAADEDAA